MLNYATLVHNRNEVQTRAIRLGLLLFMFYVSLCCDTLVVWVITVASIGLRRYKATHQHRDDVKVHTWRHATSDTCDVRQWPTAETSSAAGVQKWQKILLWKAGGDFFHCWSPRWKSHLTLVMTNLSRMMMMMWIHAKTKSRWSTALTTTPT